MAAHNPIKQLQEEATCGICLGYFVDPVSLDCGHYFCSLCLIRNWAGALVNVDCPQCRSKTCSVNFEQDMAMTHITESTRQLCDPSSAEARVCEEHQEPCQLFCLQDRVLICSVCGQSGEHQVHHVVSAEEAAQAYRLQMYVCLKNLIRAREVVMRQKTLAEVEIQRVLDEIEYNDMLSKKGVPPFCEFLEGQTKLFQQKTTEVCNEIMAKRDACILEISQELTFLNNAIEELEEKHRHFKTNFLQDGGTLPTYKVENSEKPVLDFSELRWKVWKLHDTSQYLDGTIKTFKEMAGFDYPVQEVSVTLDPATAHPSLILSEDYKSMRWGESQALLPDNPETAAEFYCVLGREKLYVGRYFWEVAVGSEEDWIVGVAKMDSLRQNLAFSDPMEGVWALGKWAGAYRMIKPPNHPPITLRMEPKNIRMALNCIKKWLCLFDADTMYALAMYSVEVSPIKPLHPFFGVCKKANITLFP
ncbi:zinc finger protein RFP-like isoform X2 [Hemicordylus capensis]|uniref:zinc finger protein RFP-like isoform X2 n=1 Tax=Hemicordylus capensis TaxID=884348 RepID=UPI0023036BA0|nr:zinc finger protein RFP-like isoform X2 [Hemicordylus capensis]